MARKRMIDPEFWRDEKIAKMNYLSRLVFIGLWNFSDDYGVGRANVDLLKADLFPFDKKLSISDIESCLQKMAELNFIQLFSVNNERYYYVINFLKHQKICRPSERIFPEPPPKKEEGNTPQLPLNEPSMSPHTEEKRREKKGNEVEVEVEEKGIHTPDKPSKLPTSKPSIQKHYFGVLSNVLLSDDEYAKLQEQLGNNAAKKIDDLSFYIGKTGKSYKSHYLAILDWERRDKEKKSDKPQRTYD